MTYNDRDGRTVKPHPASVAIVKATSFEEHKVMMQKADEEMVIHDMTTDSITPNSPRTLPIVISCVSLTAVVF